jgi:hypothetical protein
MTSLHAAWCGEVRRAKAFSLRESPEDGQDAAALVGATSAIHCVQEGYRANLGSVRCSREATEGLSLDIIVQLFPRQVAGYVSLSRKTPTTPSPHPTLNLSWSALPKPFPCSCVPPSDDLPLLHTARDAMRDERKTRRPARDAPSGARPARHPRFWPLG